MRLIWNVIIKHFYSLNRPNQDGGSIALHLLQHACYFIINTLSLLCFHHHACNLTLISNSDD